MAMSVTYGTFVGHVVYENRGGVESAYMRDPLGNTIGLLDMSGNRTDSWTYWPFGEVQTHTGSSTTSLTFLGTLGYFADFMNQLYVRARHLRPDLTCWVTLDPLWPLEPAYGYCLESPVGIIDPSGGRACGGRHCNGLTMWDKARCEEVCLGRGGTLVYCVCTAVLVVCGIYICALLEACMPPGGPKPSRPKPPEPVRFTPPVFGTQKAAGCVSFCLLSSPNDLAGFIVCMIGCLAGSTG